MYEDKTLVCKDTGAMGCVLASVAATCARCGGEAKVPFQPKSARPVYCSECFAQMRANG